LVATTQRIPQTKNPATGWADGQQGKIIEEFSLKRSWNAISLLRRRIE